MIDAEAIIAEAFPEGEAQEAIATETVVATEVAETPQDAPEAEESAVKPDSELTPEQLEKREANRVAHKNSREAKVRRENRELKQQLEQLQKPAQPPQQQTDDGRPKKPNIADFEDWQLYEKAEGDYTDKLTDWKISQRDTQTQSSAKETQHVSQAAVKIESQAKDLISKTPDYKALHSKNESYLDDLPKPIMAELFKADNAPLALYALMREGRLEEIEDVSPERLGAFLAKAEMRGESYLSQPKKATTTSAPLESLKGTGRASKDESEMSVEDIMNIYNN